MVVSKLGYGAVTRAYLSTLRFDSFPTSTNWNRIIGDVNVRIAYEELSGRALNVYKTCT